MSFNGGTAVLSHPGTTAVARPTAHLLSSIPSSRFERGLATMVMFVACYSVPNAWFTNADGSVGGSASTQQMLVFAGVLVFGIANIQFEIGPIFQLIRGEVTIPLLAAWALASTLWSVVPNDTFRLSANIVAVVLVGYWIAIRFPVSAIIGMAGVALGIGTVLELFMIKFLPQYSAVGTQWVGLLKDRNVFGRTVSLAILVLLLCWRIFPRYRLIIWGLIAVNALFLYKADSKTSTVAAACLPVMFAVFAAFRAKRTLYGAVAVVMGVFGTGAFIATAQNSGRIAQALDRNPKLSSRTPIWEAVIPEIKADPIIGHGVGGFFTRDWSGPARRVYQLINDTVPHAHNGLLNVLVDLGLVGGVLFMVAYLRLIVRGARIVRYYAGPIGMFPLMYAGYVLLISVTEYGVLTGDLHLLLYVVAIAAALPGRRDDLAANLPNFDRHRAGSSSELRRPIER